MKKTISMILALTLGITLLAGCGGSTQGASPETTGSSIAAADPANADIPESSSVTPVQDEESSDEEHADEDTGNTKASASWDFKNAGFTLKLPEDFKDCKGQLLPEDYGEVSLGSGVVFGILAYLGRTDEELRSANEEIAGLDFEGDPDGSAQKAEEISAEYYSIGMFPFLLVTGIKDGMNLDDVLDTYLNTDDIVKIGELGKAGSYKFYYIVQDPDAVTLAYKDINSEEMLMEYRSLVDRADEIAAAITVKEP